MAYYISLAIMFWAAPYCLIGLVPGFFALLDRRNYLYEDGRVGAFVVVNGPIADWFRARNWKAVTIGWVAFIWGSDNCTPEVLKHESRHIIQSTLLGVLFPVVYLGLWLIYSVKDFWQTYPFRDVITLYKMGASMWFIARGCLAEGYKNHPFERDARRHEC